MKTIKTYIIAAIALLCTSACGLLDGIGDDFTLDRSQIYGAWQTVRAKFASDAKMTDWELDSTCFYFGENGLYISIGYFGIVEDGAYTVTGNQLNCLVDNAVSVIFTVTGLEEDKAKVTATVPSNGKTVWMEWERMNIPGPSADTLEVSPIQVITPEIIYDRETDVLAAIGSIYFYITRFAQNKLKLEDQITAGNFFDLNANSKIIHTLWQDAYKSLSAINQFLAGMEAYPRDFHAPHIIHLRALRAFVAYNLATMWGNVPFQTIPWTADKLPVPVNADEILQSAIEDILSCPEDYTCGSSPWSSYLNSSARDVLLAEIYLTLENTSAAQSVLNRDFTAQDGTVFSLVEQQSNRTLIYSLDDIRLLKKEASGDIDDLVQEKSAGNHYGYWQMLKRIGKAKEVSGCKDYQLLFPIPIAEVLGSAQLPQNPGY